MNQLATLDWMIRGSVVALSALNAGVLAWSGGRTANRIAGPLFLLSMAAYALNSGPDSRAIISVARFATSLITHASVGCFWLFALVHFEDRKITPTLAAVPLALFLAGAVGELTPIGEGRGVWLAISAVSTFLAIAVLAQIARSWRHDLVEKRRSLRTGFVAAIGLLALFVLALEFGPDSGDGPSWRSISVAAALLAVSLMSMFALLDINPSQVTQSAVAPDRIPLHERAALERLAAAMDADQVWRREGLTIGALASEVGLSELALRALISEQLGYRNFPAFINAKRIEAAKEALADRSRNRETIASIAYDFGFGSLAPFNRAFREHTGLTPTEWRRKTTSEL